jgi:hypothetical protein
VGERRGKDVYGQDRRWLVGSAPPESWATGDTDRAEDGGLYVVEAAWPGAVFGVTLEPTFEPDGLAVGAQAEHSGSNTPWTLALCVRARAGAVVVVLVKPSHEVVGLACIRSGPSGGCEDVATEAPAQRHASFVAGGRH